MTNRLAFDMQGGIPQLQSLQSEEMDGVASMFQLPMMGFSKEGFSFIGWTVNGVEYPVSEEDVYAEVLGDATAYANWEKQGGAMITLKYESNGGTTKPNDDIKELPDGAESVEFTLADAIERDEGVDGRKYSFVGWEVNGVVYDAGDTVSLNADATAVAKWKGGSTTVSPKAYGYSPNGLKNALGTTRFHHQPGYPRPMGV